MTTLVLLHGLGGTRSVWGPLRSVLPSRLAVVAPDLPGHGNAPTLPAYDVVTTAGAVAEALRAEGVEGPFAVLGHSWGGAVGVALASGGYGLSVTAAVALGVKVVWSSEEVERFAALAARPAKVFATAGEALERHLVLAGLAGLVGQAGPSAQKGLDPATQSDGVRAVDGAGAGWTVAMDPRAFAQGPPDLAGHVARARGAGAAVGLLRGEHDPMVTLADLLGTGARHVADLPGLGHSAHVEDPAAVWAAAAPLLAP